jgi:hypothetical protein
MKVGDWGIGIQNDPTFHWKSTPMKDPTFGMSDEELDNYVWTPEMEKAYDEFYDRLEEFRAALKVSAMEGYKLVKAAKELGFNEENGPFEYWLFNHLATWLEKHQETAA